MEPPNPAQFLATAANPPHGALSNLYWAEDVPTSLPRKFGRRGSEAGEGGAYFEPRWIADDTDPRVVELHSEWLLRAVRLKLNPNPNGAEVITP